ncbi:MAG: type II toxin-antitoxin system RelB/DinJ family antitoxin [Defluviitaleaceae bacterium]|nr:type II toxin-antitoxin system RelB/DinJ family antitoxin [Defluviitaleaceae bacterium]
MVKTETIHMRIEPDVKREAENILTRLGLSTTDAIKVFLNQVILRGGLPFEVRLNIPNETTKAAMYEAENNINLHKFPNADEMFRELGI